MPLKKQDAQVVDLQEKSSFLFLLSLPPSEAVGLLTSHCIPRQLAASIPLSRFISHIRRGVSRFVTNQEMVGATGFEPATSWTQTTRSSQAELRSVPANHPMNFTARNHNLPLHPLKQLDAPTVHV